MLEEYNRVMVDFLSWDPFVYFIFHRSQVHLVREPQLCTWISTDYKEENSYHIGSSLISSKHLYMIQHINYVEGLLFPMKK